MQSALRKNAEGISPTTPTFPKDAYQSNASHNKSTASPNHRHGHAHSHSHAGLSTFQSGTAFGTLPTGGSDSSGTVPNNLKDLRSVSGEQKLRQSVDGNFGGSYGRGWASTTNTPNPHSYTEKGIRPSSELLNAGFGRASQGNTNSDTDHAIFELSLHRGHSFSLYTPADAINRWFEDLQHYEATLEEMAAASLDTNFKEELSAIEQWFRVLSEAERTAALYSLLQSSTQVQMRFFVTVLQQMAKANPINALLSPANPSQLSLEAQMEAKLASMGLKSPASPAIRQFARQSLGAGAIPAPADPQMLSPMTASTATLPSVVASHRDGNDENQAPPHAAATLVNQRAKLKATSRTSAPAGFSAPTGDGISNSSKTPWGENEKLAEGRPISPADRPKSTETMSRNDGKLISSSLQSSRNLPQGPPPPSSASFVRSPNSIDFEGLSPLVGGSWASMVSTPQVPMFGGKQIFTNEQRENATSPKVPGLGGPDDITWRRLEKANEEGIVLDDVRKFRRSARVGGGTTEAFGLSCSPSGSNDDTSHQEAQRRYQRNSMQQNAINLGLVGLNASQQQTATTKNGAQSAGLASPGLLSAQQAAVAAQQNWRNGLSSPSIFGSMPILDSTFSQPNVDVAMSGGNPHLNGVLTANAQLANLYAIQQQLLQQQQQQQIHQMSLATAAGVTLSPMQMLSLQQQQQQQQALLNSARGLSTGIGMANLAMYKMGISSIVANAGYGSVGTTAGPNTVRRSPLPNDRSPVGHISSSPILNNCSSAKSALPSSTGSGTNPDEPLDFSLLNDIPAWLRSLRLHKYTSNFEHSTWKEMVKLDDAGLEAQGVFALGARRKLLKVFETIRDKLSDSTPNVLPMQHQPGAKLVDASAADVTSPHTVELSAV